MKIILFDGICNLCNASVNFVLDHDKNNIFKFSPLQSEASKEILKKINPSQTETSSIIFIDDDKYYTQSTAILMITSYLDGMGKLGPVFFVVPRIIRDSIYRLIAHNRYKWFGKRNQCRVPTPALKERFL